MNRLGLARTMRKLAFLSMIALAPCSAHSGTLSGTITDIFYFMPAPTIVFISIAGQISGAPACATGYLHQMTLDLSNPTGKAIYANLLALMLTNPSKVVTLNGSNTCDQYGDRESVQYFFGQP